ncbi:MAG TPA: hypothetical protein VF974_07025 [Patescibacteria group bacterium]
MKLPQLLSQFLYQTKKLDLPGIGSFVLDPAVVLPEESDKSGQTVAAGITFKNSLVTTPDDALIVFIKEHTGKMKPLAAADLDFYLTTGKQLLNIGKPFYLEGIGTLMQNKEGRLNFTPGEYSTARLLDPTAEKKERAEKKKTPTTYDEPPREYEPRSNTVRQTLLLIGLIGGLVAIGWGGYYLYKRNTFVEPTTETKPVKENKPAVVTDSGHSPADSTKGPQTVTTKPSDNPAKPVATAPSTAAPVEVPPGASLYKFVILQTTKKGRALRRYNQLLGYQLNIKMDQKDSSYFKLYFPIAATIRDTTHIKDSLVDIYAAHVTIEH